MARALKLSAEERAVLTVLAANDDAWLNWFFHDIVAAAGETQADAVCRTLRRRKLADGQGSGRWAQYGINDAGRAALAA